MNIPLANGAVVELVVGLRKRGYAVGIVSDSFYVAPKSYEIACLRTSALPTCFDSNNEKATG